MRYSGPLAEIYEDKGDRYESIPPIIVDGFTTWRTHIVKGKHNVLDQAGISKRFYFNFRGKLNELIKLFENKEKIVIYNR